MDTGISFSKLEKKIRLSVESVRFSYSIVIEHVKGVSSTLSLKTAIKKTEISYKGILSLFYDSRGYLQGPPKKIPQKLRS